MKITEEMIKLIVQKVIDIVENKTNVRQNARSEIVLEVSARHVHLSQDIADALFGKGYKLKAKRALLQSGEFLAEERVTLIGPRGVLENVAILGPIRSKTQIELAPSDARRLGISAPVRDSGDVSNTPGVIIASSDGSVKIGQGVILARRHIHMTPTDAENLKLKDKDVVRVAIKGARPLVFGDVLIRVSENFTLAMHIDTDEAGACGAEPDTEVEILRDFCCTPKTTDKCNIQTDKIIKDKLVTEDKMLALIKSGYSRIIISKKTVVTPLAMDCARSAKVKVIREKT